MPSHALYDSIFGSYTLGQCSSASYSPGAQVIDGVNSGAVDVDEYYGGPCDPQASFETLDAGGAITAVSVTTGLSVAAGTITMPWNKRANQSTFAGSNNFKLSGTDGLLVANQFDASQDGDVSVSLTFYWVATDGLTNPVGKAANASLASQTFNAHWSFGPAYIDGSQVDECIGWTVGTGVEVVCHRFDGANYPTKCYIVRRRPYIDLRFADLSDVNSFTTSHYALTSAAVYGRKRSGASFVAAGTSQHVKLSLGAGLLKLENLGASGRGDGTFTLRLHGEALTASAASAIP